MIKATLKESFKNGSRRPLGKNANSKGTRGLDSSCCLECELWSPLSFDPRRLDQPKSAITFCQRLKMHIKGYRALLLWTFPFCLYTLFLTFFGVLVSAPPQQVTPHSACL